MWSVVHVSCQVCSGNKVGQAASTPEVRSVISSFPPASRPEAQHNVTRNLAQWLGAFDWREDVLSRAHTNRGLTI
jgi:hypothetical protein